LEGTLVDYITAKEAAIFWGISQRRVAVLCSEERIDGAKLIGNMWLIPVRASKPDDARSLRFQPKTPASVKPFLKWAGGKAQILENIKMKYPIELGKSVSKYAEPFVGGGAVLFDILSNYDMKEVYISDINRELILTYKTIRKNVDELISHLKHLEANYLPASEEKRKILYYQNRERFNALKIAYDESPEIVALFIALNKTCFNGLYRVNSKGEYNVPQGGYKSPRICDEENLNAISKKLRNVQVICGDYKESAQFIDDRTFAYFDPPYRPLTESASFTSYTQDGFGDREQVELARFIDKMSERGAHIVASNSDPKNINEQDSFFDELYARHKIFRISASRAINSIGNRRGKINELLISSY
jgi:DNA adenine methylase